eukprot:TRINITY_DN6897_c0_g1_i1.p1 TRINITY_DN6897_c0_g1~~TRINITY_DN6897_c0_g1_i1.p1  ORF type:complete len:1483 (-),score=356.31 TRINITY_DN6897_c0_g1_i1:3-4016(-)
MPARLPEGFPSDFSFTSETAFEVIKSTKSHTQAQFSFSRVAASSPFYIVVNGIQHVVDSVDPTMSLNTFIRSLPGHKGTKLSCGEGGCGACTVLLSETSSSGDVKSFSVNSCLRPLVACYGKSVTTVEGIGSQKKGYNAIQSRLAEADGTQCGFCSPGFVMNMYSLLTNIENPTKEEVEKYFDGNLCRCTGFRPILDAFKSFATEDEASSTHKKCAGACGKAGTSSCKNACKLSSLGVPDIEELGLPQWEEHKYEAKHVVVSERLVPPPAFVKGGVQWLSPTSLADLYTVMAQNPNASFVFGHTSRGIFKDWNPSTFIDLQNVPELKGNSYVPNMNALSFGATTTIAEFQKSLVAYQNSTTLTDVQKSVLPELLYMVGRIAGTQIRNAASIAGNLTLANKHSFPSDLCISLIALGGTVTLGNSTGEKTIAIQDFVSADITGYVVKSISFSLGLPTMVYKTYKVAIRNVMAHSIVNSAFMATVAKDQVTNPPIIAFGNIRTKQARMPQTESVLMGGALSDVNTLQKALQTLSNELNVDQTIGRNQYRKNLALGMFYKFYLSLLPAGSVPPSIASGMTKFSRPVSSGQQSYQSDPKEAPVSEPIHKLKGHQQTSGEAQYTDDIPTPEGTLHGAFVLSTVASATIDTVDVTAALAYPGVVDWIDANDVPGKNVTDLQIPIFATSDINYCGQAIGMIIATTQKIANDAAKLVVVTYKNIQTPVITIEDALNANSFYPVEFKPVVLGDTDKGFEDSDYVVSGTFNLGGQFHFHMETHSALIIPGENNEIQAYIATQMSAALQSLIASVLNQPDNSIYVQVKRCGGGYGGKLANSEPMAAALAVAATKLGAPVRGVMDIDTQMYIFGRRPAHKADYSFGFMKDGTIKALTVNTYTEGGCAAADTMFIAQSMLSSIDSCYNIPNLKFVAHLMKTNTAPNTSVRGPGWTPAVHMMEHIMEHGASFLQMEPSAFKEMNFFKKGQSLPNGTVLSYWNMDTIWSQLKTTADYDNRLAAVNAFNVANTWKKKGLAIVPVRWAAGWAGDHHSALINVCSDGTVVVYHSGIEIGQGIDTKVAQIVAFKLGVPLTSITVLNHNNATSINAGATGGSVTSSLCCTAAYKACETLNERLAPIRSVLHMTGAGDLTWPELITKALAAGVNLSAQGDVFPPPGPLSAEIAYNSYSAAVQEVEVDIISGEIQLLRTDILFDAGVSLNPAVDIGQVEGGFVMGLGLVLTEEILYNTAGELITHNTWEYKPPSALDIPIDFRISLLKDAPNPLDIMSSKLSGEPPLCLSVVAVFAIQHAIRDFRAQTGQSVADFGLNTPVTVENAQLGCGITPEMFLLK